MIDKLNADLYANEHANMDSLPFRYGFQYPRDRTIELYKASDWEQQTNDRYKVTASFQDARGNEQRGTFILMKTQSPILKVVTIWRNDQKNEFYLSELMTRLRKDKKITALDLIDLHPRYMSGELVTMSALFDALLMKKGSALRETDPDIEEKIKAKYEDQIKKLQNETSRVREIAEVAVKGLKEQENIIREQNKDSFGAVLDLGCGTGLLGEKIKPFCNRLVGVDLSDKMLSKAKKKGIYDELAHQDIKEFISSQQLQYNYYIFTDVFIYIGDLRDIFSIIKKRSEVGGSLVFTTEDTEKNDYFLEKSGRFSHSKKYIECLSQEFGYQIIHSEIQNLRLENGKFIPGRYYLLEFGEQQ